ncbi:phosphoserine phosphatase [Frankliniella occidentalis]|uniref:Phosphoserine phosphatase n=1 Tax=Frankliniella occidentalis TaxID=133901 RepID=A0A6J1TAF0_FRAOC|nr:phosphoserine phosphatase [Frankliniella occidentalis]
MVNPDFLSSMPIIRNMDSSDQARYLWRTADAVCFDVDSTVIMDEAIDEMAKYCGKGDAVAALTKEAMKGSMNFREALAMRLNIIKPSTSQIKSFLQNEPARLTPRIKELVEELHKRRIPVYLISGGFRSLIQPIAQELNIPIQNVYANRLKFYYNGEYAGFDEDEPTSRQGGKGDVIKMLKKTHRYNSIILIGDGATDLEACPPADAFIGFGGNVVREEVRSRAKWFVSDFKDLIDAL